MNKLTGKDYPNTSSNFRDFVDKRGRVPDSQVELDAYTSVTDLTDRELELTVIDKIVLWERLTEYASLLDDIGAYTVVRDSVLESYMDLADRTDYPKNVYAEIMRAIARLESCLCYLNELGVSLEERRLT